ncbi:ABC transporter permease [Nostoc sp. TCL26-01]|uniref:ABC transporter permease n=1 Tax=Nostoc sp. TCL26-01 TaxID=2576904 RepID=UPI0015BA049F|nr:ABC transporter permease [Nostoc sp. TCL26-01]QLE54421.1 ABC transporter permease [Nostoc sp. TCL26-01]
MLNLFLVELKRSWILFIRYPIEAIGAIIAITGIFYGLFAGARYMAGPGLQFGERLDAIIVGYVLWSLVVFVIGNISSDLQHEAEIGTIEQIFLSPYKAPKIFLVRALASLTINMVLNLSVLILILIITGRKLYFPFTLIFPLGTVFLGACGLAFAMGALSLLFQRISQLLSLFQFLLLFLLMAPTETWTGGGKLLSFLLPLSPSAGMLRDLIVRNQQFNFAQFGGVVLNAILYFSLGIICFNYAEYIAKKRGLLGKY